MFTFQQNKFTECQPCPVEVFKRLTQAPSTAETIDDHRRLLACGDKAKAREKKDSLPGFLFQAKEVLVSMGKAEYNKGKMGHWRLQSQCVLNGLVMCDFDHVSKEPYGEDGSDPRSYCDDRQSLQRLFKNFLRSEMG